jgi:uncharacterized damage-inducible protein DinB
MGGMTAPTERAEPELVLDERAMLIGWLDYHRATLAWKCDGLAPDQLRQRSVPPSTLSLIGLVRHMAEVERSWFRRRMAGLDAPPLYYTDEKPDDDFDAIEDADVVQVFADWAAECDFARDFVDQAADLDLIGLGYRTKPLSLRWVLTHMIEEYARHNGHADLLRERIDGAVGD